MTSKFLPVIVKNALLLNQDRLPRLTSGKAKANEVLAFCENFRTAAIGALFLTATSNRFLHHLHQSGRAFAAFLSRAGNDSPRLSQYAPFFDAVCATDDEGATEIARRACRNWMKGEEYEEDFLFVDFLMQSFFLGATAGQCEELLTRYKKALLGAEDLRLDICEALLKKDSDAFNESLARYLSERKAFQEKMAETSVIPEEQLATGWNLSIEGLALVRLAEKNGMETEEDYLHIPSLARESRPATFQPDSWMHINVTETLPQVSRPRRNR